MDSTLAVWKRVWPSQQHNFLQNAELQAPKDATRTGLKSTCLLILPGVASEEADGARLSQ